MAERGGGRGRGSSRGSTRGGGGVGTSSHHHHRGRGASRGSYHGSSSSSSGRPRRAADYTPVQEPRADQATIGEAARRAAEAADRDEQEQEQAHAELMRLRLSDKDNTLESPAAADNDKAGSAGEQPQEDEEDHQPEIQHTCYICAEPVKYFMLGTCSHRTCHICTTRLRSLYKKKECTFCKTELATVICTGTRDAEVAYENFPPDAFPYSDHKLGIAFQTNEMMQDVLALLRFNCPQLDCDYMGTGWADLKKHARAAHGLVFCDLCTKYKKIFGERPEPPAARQCKLTMHW